MPESPDGTGINQAIDYGKCTFIAQQLKYNNNLTIFLYAGSLQIGTDMITGQQNGVLVSQL